MNITLADFISAERQHTIDFYEWWTRMHRVNPEKFPLNLPQGMWAEQFQKWERD